MPVDDLAAAVLEHEHNAEPRWVWPSAALVYQRLLRAGVRVARCHDVALADALISGRDAALGRSASETSLGAGEAGSGAGEAGSGAELGECGCGARLALILRAAEASWA